MGGNGCCLYFSVAGFCASPCTPWGARRRRGLEDGQELKTSGRLGDLTTLSGDLRTSRRECAKGAEDGPGERTGRDQDRGQPGDTRSLHGGDSPVRREGGFSIGIFKQGSPCRTWLDPRPCGSLGGSRMPGPVALLCSRLAASVPGSSDPFLCWHSDVSKTRRLFLTLLLFPVGPPPPCPSHTPETTYLYHNLHAII